MTAGKHVRGCPLFTHPSQRPAGHPTECTCPPRVTPRRKPIRILHSPLTDSWFIVTRYTEPVPGQVEAIEKQPIVAEDLAKLRALDVERMARARHAQHHGYRDDSTTTCPDCVSEADYLAEGYEAAAAS